MAEYEQHVDEVEEQEIKKSGRHCVLYGRRGCLGGKQLFVEELEGDGQSDQDDDAQAGPYEGQCAQDRCVPKTRLLHGGSFSHALR